MPKIAGVAEVAAELRRGGGPELGLGGGLLPVGSGDDRGLGRVNRLIKSAKSAEHATTADRVVWGRVKEEPQDISTWDHGVDVRGR